MTAISTGINLDAVSATVGYKIEGSLEGIGGVNLPQSIIVLAEVTESKQSEVTNGLYKFQTAKQVATKYGDGCPAYLAARILRPISGDKLGSIPTYILPVAKGTAATAKVITYSISGTATASTTHYLKVCGRKSLDNQVYAFSVLEGETNAQIHAKMIDAVNAVFGCPVTGSADNNKAIFTTDWNGLSAAEVTVTIDTNGNAAGLTYTIDSATGGAVDAKYADALALISQDVWYTKIVNCVSNGATLLTALEAMNGNPNDADGRFTPNIFKPFMAYFGSTTDSLSTLTSLLDARKGECTNVLCPAPNSEGLSFEAAANVVYSIAPIANNTPHIDPIGLKYNDMPTPEDGDIGDFADQRDALVKIGASTVKLNGTQYEIVDLVTTYHPDDEPQTAALFRWDRDLTCMFNIRYAYLVQERIYVTGKTIVGDSVPVSASNTISPKRWKGVFLNEVIKPLIDSGIITDFEFTKQNTNVKVGDSNANRLETNFKVKLTGIARILDTTNVVTFNFG